MKRYLIITVMILALIGAACSSTDAEETPTTQPEPTVATIDTAEPTPTQETAAANPDLPEWQTVALTDVRTGSTFTFADFAGQTVFVEPMATWCSNCRSQLRTVSSVREQFGEDVVFIGLSLETNLSDDELRQYTADEGFNWTFAVMSEEILRQLADEFGRSVTNAPSTPHFIIRPDGSFTELDTGMESADELIQQINDAMGV
jgi:thiol-disulfide isomerase/thioredoxin